MSDDLKPIVEALIFASPDPITPKTLFQLLESEPREDVETALEALKKDYERPGGLQLVEVAGGYQIVTRPELHEWVRQLFHERSKQKLSVPALETLAVIAYKQPVTGPEITGIRGVDPSGVLGTLLERRFIKVVGAQGGGRSAVPLCHDTRVLESVRPQRSERPAQGRGYGRGPRHRGPPRLVGVRRGSGQPALRGKIRRSPIRN